MLCEAKKCSQCGEEKPTTEYYKGKAACKVCVKANAAERYKRDKDIVDERNRQWYQKNREAQKQYSREYHRKYKDRINKKRREQNATNKEVIAERTKRYNAKPEKRYRIYEQSAQKRGHLFELSFEEFMTLWGAPCVYCGADIELIGLDRADNNEGYTINNVVSCCSQCNYAKGKMGVNEWKEYRERLVKFFLDKSEFSI